MSRFDKRRVTAGIVLVGVVMQTGFAAAAWLGRRHAEDCVAAAVGREVDLELRAEGASESPASLTPATNVAWQIDDAPDTSGTLQRIQSIGDAGGVELTGLAAAKSGTAGKQSFKITGAAEPSRLCAFLAAIESEDPLIVVESGRILPGTEQAVVFDISLAAYHKLAAGGER